MSRNLYDSTFVFISSHDRPVMGRMDRRMLKVMEALRLHDVVVNLVCTPTSELAEPARELGITVAPYNLDKFNVVRTRSRLRKYLRRYEPAVAHSTGYLGDMLLRMAAGPLPVKVVNSVQCVKWPWSGSNVITTEARRLLDLRTMRRADVLIADCPGFAETLRTSHYPVPEIVFDPPSVDLARLGALAEMHSAFERRPGVPAIGYAGSLEPSRGLETLIEAGRILNTRGRKVDVIIAGEGPERPRLQVLAERAGSTFLLGRVHSVPAVLRRLDVCCFPSTEAGSPTSLLEAAALGRPIVCTDVPGLGDIFAPSEVRTVPPGDPLGLAAAIEAFLGDRESAERYGGEARLHVVDEYSSTASVARHLELYRRLLSD